MASSYQTYTYCKALRDDAVLVTVHQTPEPKPSFLGRLRRRISRRKLPPSSPSSPSPSPSLSKPEACHLALSPDPVPSKQVAPARAFVYDPSVPTPLLTLPNELLLITASFLEDPSDLNALLQTNSRFASLLSPLCLQNFDCSVTALCWAVVTSNETMARLLLGKRGPGFVLFDRDGSVGYPALRDAGGERPRLGWMFVIGPRLMFRVPGMLEHITVREWAERGKWRRILSYCWSPDEKRGWVWGRMVRDGL